MKISIPSDYKFGKIGEKEGYLIILCEGLIASNDIVSGNAWKAAYFLSDNKTYITINLDLLEYDEIFQISISNQNEL